MAGPKIIHQSFTTFGDGEYAVDPRVVKRIREEYDRFFCPLFRQQVWQWEDGTIRKYKHFGVGASSKEDLPIDGTIYAAMRPTYGYLSKIEPACSAVVWFQDDNKPDGTPAPTMPFSDNIYYHVKRLFEHTRELEYNARQRQKTQGLTFAKEFDRRVKEKNEAEFAFEKSEAAYRLKQEIPRIRKAIDETTQEDVEKLYDKQTQSPKPFVHLAQ